MAVYTGSETKISQNRLETVAHTKWTPLDRRVNQATALIFLLQLAIVAVLGALGESWRVHNSQQVSAHARTHARSIFLPLYLLRLLLLLDSLSHTANLCQCSHARARSAQNLIAFALPPSCSCSLVSGVWLLLVGWWGGYLAVVLAADHASLVWPHRFAAPLSVALLHDEYDLSSSSFL